MCQTATLVPILNALRDSATLDSEAMNFTQAELVKRVADPDWEKAMKAKKCYSLDKYAGIIRKALPLFLNKKYEVRVVHVDPKSAADVKKVTEDLVKNEKSAGNFIIANFDQARFTGEAEAAGHVSPVAAYDAIKRRVLILDVDRDWYEPYWVPFSEFIEAMGTRDSAAELNRGYLVIEPAQD